MTTVEYCPDSRFRRCKGSDLVGEKSLGRDSHSWCLPPGSAQSDNRKLMGWKLPSGILSYKRNGLYRNSMRLKLSLVLKHLSMKSKKELNLNWFGST
jgi:hypothetical protein